MEEMDQTFGSLSGLEMVDFDVNVNEISFDGEVSFEDFQTGLKRKRSHADDESFNLDLNEASPASPSSPQVTPLLLQTIFLLQQ